MLEPEKNKTSERRHYWLLVFCLSAVVVAVLEPQATDAEGFVALLLLKAFIVTLCVGVALHFSDALKK